MSESIENIVILVLAALGLAAIVYLFRGFSRPGGIGSRSSIKDADREILNEAKLLKKEVRKQAKEREKKISSLENMAKQDPEKVAGVIGKWISRDSGTRYDPLKPTKENLEQYLN